MALDAAHKNDRLFIDIASFLSKFEMRRRR
jgi:hypothetical protein